MQTETVVAEIAAAEQLEDASLLCANADNFDLLFTAAFDWADDGAIRFFYTQGETTYSAQLRMFHGDNKYFITQRAPWPGQQQAFKLFHYLDALKYMPQQDIRRLSPTADGYSVTQLPDGAPGDYARVLQYGQHGTAQLDGWHIHVLVQPLHKAADGSFMGSGDEAIHLFYSAAAA